MHGSDRNCTTWTCKLAPLPIRLPPKAKIGASQPIIGNRWPKTDLPGGSSDWDKWPNISMPFALTISWVSFAFGASRRMLWKEFWDISYPHCRFLLRSFPAEGFSSNVIVSLNLISLIRCCFRYLDTNRQK